MGRGAQRDTEAVAPHLRGGALTPPPDALDPDELAEVVQVSLWIRPAHDRRSVTVEIEGYGYDEPLRINYDICIDDDASGPLSAEVLRGLVTREVVARIAAELGVPYDRR